jgi:ribonucleotide monophosphatase NagD (HAD superfamily)
MVGDNPVADVAEARAAGIPGLLVDPGPSLKNAVETIVRFGAGGGSGGAMVDDVYDVDGAVPLAGDLAEFLGFLRRETAA